MADHVLSVLQPDVFVAGTLKGRPGPKRVARALEEIGALRPFARVSVIRMPTVAVLREALQASGHWEEFLRTASGKGSGQVPGMSADKRKCEWEGWEEIAGHPNDGEWRNGWSEKEWERGIPQQRNGFDCGVFMCKNADYHARDGLLNFTQADIDYFRRRIVLEIRNCALIDDDPPPGGA